MRKLVLLCRLGLAGLLALGTAGCQAAATTLPFGDDTPVAERVARADRVLAEVNGNAPAQQQRLLLAAMMYVSGQAYAKAQDTLNRIDTQQLARELRGDFLVAGVDAALGLDDVAGAMAIVARGSDGRYPFVDDLTAADFARVAERRALVLERRNQLPDAVRERAVADRQLPLARRKANEEALWSLLMRASREQLQALAGSPGDTEGWATLALAWRDGATDPERLVAGIDGWVARHRGHPAAERPPAPIEKVRSAPRAASPTRVAVLLPLHGKLASAGLALQRGILAAWFDAREATGKAPEIRFLDSSRSDFLAIYDDAVREGAQILIGPLEKENLRLLQQRASLPVTTIALNYPDGPGGPAGLHYFGLAGEDEAAQIAASAAAQGLKRAAVLYPAGEWGQRMYQQLAQTLQQQGGAIRAAASFQGNGDYNDVVRNLLDVGTSEIRHDRVERVTGTPLAFEPRRRADIDCLFVIGNTLQASQLVPAVGYYYATGLPILATSQVNGQPTATSANDLAGVRFVEMPWIADPGHPLRERMAAAWKEPDERAQRLHALGVDAWRLALQLPMLSQSPDASVDGVTGQLTMGSDRRIHRRLSWMTYVDGHVEALADQP